MTSEKVLHTLIMENAFDFLDRALNEFESSPKYSVIHFYAAVELFLKARLLTEHWSLVVSKRQEPDRTRFESGDFLSVTLEEAADRLEKAVRAPLTKVEFESFRTLAKHRNKMVHFFHRIDGGGADLRVQIAQEQLTAWYYLNNALLSRWRDVFENWVDEIERIDGRLRQHRAYLAVVFEQRKEEIEKARSRGSTIVPCHLCGFEALVADEIVGPLMEARCVTCRYEGKLLKAECPKCADEVVLIDEGFGSCPKCDRRIEPGDVAGGLTKHRLGSKELFESGEPANCGSCDAENCVVELEELYFCASCFELFEMHDIGQCGWCGATNVGRDMNDSSWSGCVACSGMAGDMADRD
jgi:hypothetical protein